MPKRFRFEINRYTGIGFGIALSATGGGDPWRWNFGLVLPCVVFSCWFGRRPADPWREVRRG